MLAFLSTAQLALGKDAAEIRAREQFRAGQTAYAASQYDRALTAFSEAYGLEPAPGLLFNIAQCHRKLGNYERAVVFYRQYLELSPSNRNAAAVRALLGEVEVSEKEKRRRLAQQEKLQRAKLQLPGEPALATELLGSNGRGGELIRSGASDDSIFTKWWFWSAVGAIAVGSTAYLLANQHAVDTRLPR